MSVRTSLWVAGTCAMITLLAGCSSADTPEPSVVTTVSPTGKPAISRPLDATRYANRENICELVTKEQAKHLEVRDDDGPRPISGRDYQMCAYSQMGPTTPVNVNIELRSGNWLEDLYKPEKDDESSWITISGQPAVAYGDDGDQPHSCRVAIGLAERQSAFVWVLDFSRDACDVAIAIGLEIVRNLS